MLTFQLQSSHTQQVIQQFHEILDSKHQAFANGPFHRLELCGILVAPEVSGTLKSVDRIPIASWSDYLSAKLTGTITTVTSFLPLAIEHQARIIVLTPSIIHSLSPPLHSMEATTVGALESYTHSLRRELSPAGVSVSHIQLGSIDFGALLRGSEYQRTRENKSSQPSVLHEAVFDALTMEGPFGSRRVGRGATVYGLIGSFAPTSLVDWMVRPKRGSTGPYKLISAE
jgi:NAD(P)-dependent dehydrogenase (short-subunit alcohol dehydrogenase family)